MFTLPEILFQKKSVQCPKAGGGRMNHILRRVVSKCVCFQVINTRWLCVMPQTKQTDQEKRGTRPLTRLKN